MQRTFPSTTAYHYPSHNKLIIYLINDYVTSWPRLRAVFLTYLTTRWCQDVHPVLVVHLVSVYYLPSTCTITISVTKRHQIECWILTMITKLWKRKVSTEQRCMAGVGVRGSLPSRLETRNGKLHLACRLEAALLNRLGPLRLPWFNDRSLGEQPRFRSYFKYPLYSFPLLTCLTSFWNIVPLQKCLIKYYIGYLSSDGELIQTSEVRGRWLGSMQWGCLVVAIET